MDAERFIRKLYGWNIALVDRQAQANRALTADEAVRLVRAFDTDSELPMSTVDIEAAQSRAVRDLRDEEDRKILADVQRAIDAHPAPMPKSPAGLPNFDVGSSGSGVLFTFEERLPDAVVSRILTEVRENFVYQVLDARTLSAVRAVALKRLVSMTRSRSLYRDPLGQWCWNDLEWEGR